MREALLWVSDRISVAACGMSVPGRWIALTPAFLQKIIILRWDPAPTNTLLPPSPPRFAPRRQGFCGRPLARDDDDMDVALDRLPRRLLGSSNQRPRGGWRRPA